jgi:hypothetical protein
MPIPRPFHGARRAVNDMRQWELFGITDSQPGWAPPKRVDDIDTVVTVLDIPEDDEDLLPEPAA